MSIVQCQIEGQGSMTIVECHELNQGSMSIVECQVQSQRSKTIVQCHVQRPVICATEKPSAYRKPLHRTTMRQLKTP